MTGHSDKSLWKGKLVLQEKIDPKKEQLVLQRVAKLFGQEDFCGCHPTWLTVRIVLGISGLAGLD